MSAAAASKHIDLVALSLPELRELAEQIRKHIAERTESEKAALLAEFEKRAKEKGFASLAEVLPPVAIPVEPEPAPQSRGKQAVVAPKYWKLDDHSLTWSGRGRQPKFVQEHLAAGGTLEELAIPPA